MSGFQIVTTEAGIPVGVEYATTKGRHFISLSKITRVTLFQNQIKLGLGCKHSHSFPGDATMYRQVRQALATREANKVLK